MAFKQRFRLIQERAAVMGLRNRCSGLFYWSPSVYLRYGEEVVVLRGRHVCAATKQGCSLRSRCRWKELCDAFTAPPQTRQARHPLLISDGRSTTLTETTLRGFAPWGGNPDAILPTSVSIMGASSFGAFGLTTGFVFHARVGRFVTRHSRSESPSLLFLFVFLSRRIYPRVLSARCCLFTSKQPLQQQQQQHARGRVMPEVAEAAEELLREAEDLFKGVFVARRVVSILSKSVGVETKSTGMCLARLSVVPRHARFRRPVVSVSSTF